MDLDPSLLGQYEVGIAHLERSYLPSWLPACQPCLQVCIEDQEDQEDQEDLYPTIIGLGHRLQLIAERRPYPLLISDPLIPTWTLASVRRVSFV